MRFRGLILVICLLLVSSPAFSGERGWEWIKPDRVYNLLLEGSGMWLVDVRNSSQFEQSHIEGAVNISVLNLKYRNYPKGKLFVLGGGSPGQREAREAADVLVEKGYMNVYVLEGGITGWRLEELPMVSSGEYKAMGVTARELDWALKNNVPLKVFDLRGETENEQGAVPGSQSISGGNSNERLDSLRGILEKEPSQAKRLAGLETVVLVFSASEDAERFTEKVSFGLKKDVRYLLGGYEAYAALGRTGIRKVSKSGDGQTCPQTN